MKHFLRIAGPMLALAALTGLPFAATGQQKKPQAPKSSLRLYILDCGDSGLEAFLKIQHATADNAKLKKAPEFYE